METLDIDLLLVNYLKRDIRVIEGSSSKFAEKKYHIAG